MLNMVEIASAVRQRAKSRLRPDSEEFRNTRALAVISQPFYERLVDACTRVSDRPALPSEVHVAFPERLFGKVAYLLFGERSAKRAPVTEDAAQRLLATYDDLQRDVHYANLTTAGAWEAAKAVLVCHGLSPVGDSPLL